MACPVGCAPVARDLTRPRASINLSPTLWKEPKCTRWQRSTLLPAAGVKANACCRLNLGCSLPGLPFQSRDPLAGRTAIAEIVLPYSRERRHVDTWKEAGCAG